MHSQCFALGQAFKDKFVKIGQEAIKGACRSIPLTNFYSQRLAVQAAVLARLKTDFANDFVNIHGFQLRKVSLPVQTEGQILSTLVTLESAKTTLNQQAKKSIQADTLVISADADATIKTISANATSEASVLTNVANALGKKPSCCAVTVGARCLFPVVLYVDLSKAGIVLPCGVIVCSFVFWLCAAPSNLASLPLPNPASATRLQAEGSAFENIRVALGLSQTEVITISCHFWQQPHCKTRGLALNASCFCIIV
jgi:hypothetical protein